MDCALVVIEGRRGRDSPCPALRGLGGLDSISQTILRKMVARRRYSLAAGFAPRRRRLFAVIGLWTERLDRHFFARNLWCFHRLYMGRSRNRSRGHGVSVDGSGDPVGI